MTRYIDADALKRDIVDVKVKLCPENRDYGVGYFSALSVVEGMLAYAPTPTLDDLRPKGCWNIVEFDDVSRRITIECSECGMVEELTLMAYGFGHNFCHICGADMREGGENG